MKKSFLLLLCATFSLLMQAQKAPKRVSKKTIAKIITEKKDLPLGYEEVELSAFVISVGTGSKGTLPDVTQASAILEVNFQGEPTTGHTAKYLYLNVIPDAAIFKNPSFNVDDKAIYMDIPISYYKSVMDLIALTIDKTGGKKLIAVYFEDNTGKSYCFFSMR